MNKIILLSLLLGTLPAQTHPTSYRTETCYKNVVQEEYIPPHRSHYGEGYINRYYDKVQIPCSVVHSHGHTYAQPLAYQEQKTPKCTSNTTTISTIVRSSVLGFLVIIRARSTCTP